MLGLRRGTVVLETYRQGWASLFQEEAERLSCRIGRKAVAIEHIGSTAIPGMAAKPILDMMIGVHSMSDADLILDDVVTMGYLRRENGDLADRIFLVKGPESLRTHHLSITYIGSAFWQDHIQFREALREDKTLATAYLELKSRLAKTFGQDRERYTAGKERFVKEVLASLKV